MPAWSNWVKIHWDYIVCLPGQIGCKSLRLHCIPAQSNWSNWVVELVEIIEITLYACPVKLGGPFGWKSLRLHCMPAQSNQLNWVEIHWDYIVCLPGQIGCKSLRLHCMPAWWNWVEIHWDYIVCMPGQIRCKSLRLHCKPAWSNRSNWVEIHWDYIVCLPSWIGCKSLRLHCMPAWSNRSNWVEIIEITLYVCPVELGVNHWDSTRQADNVISMDFHPIWPVKFDRHLKPLMGIQCNLNGFPPNLTGQIQPASKAFNRHTMLSQWISTQFNRSNSTGI